MRLIVKLGDQLPKKAGKVADIGVKKQWLTKQDIAIERQLAKVIMQFQGKHEIFAEELHDTFVDSENVWVIDPISHTYSYLHGLPHYAVVVTHLHKGDPVFTAVYDPTMKELFTAQKNKGAFLNGKRIHVQPNSDACILSEFFRETHTKELKKAMRLFGEIIAFGRLKILGSVALSYAYVACGRVQATVIRGEDGFTAIAGRLLVEEADGTFTGFKGEPYTFSSSGALATAGDLHRKLLPIVKKYIKV